MTQVFVPTRMAGLERLAEFTGRMGTHYAERRNTQAPPGEHTSGLSPYLRRRMVVENEAVHAARAAHGAAADKFVQEVYWRTYFKGYLELRPSIWTDYLAQVEQAQVLLGHDTGLAQRYRAAVAGRTGIDAFDDWAGTLIRDNWLHNHARMWFASIWIFTLGLPWVLGADFFLRHLVDGDPASNTLSWRWVAGLHTRGKHYVATAENIRRFTDGRYRPTGLNERPAPLTELPPPAPTALAAASPPPDGEVTLLLHLDDLHPETWPLGRARVMCVWPHLVHATGTAEAVQAFDRAAMDEALTRAVAFFGCKIEPPAKNLPLVTAWAPIGPTAARLPEAAQVRRPWDDQNWPACTGGYRLLRERIPPSGSF